jgi:hypothetical protein
MPKGTILREKEDLPEWFDLAKYKRTREFDAAEWYDQLSMRMNIHNNISVDASDAEKLDSNYQSLLDALKTITQYGLISPSNFPDSRRLASFLLSQGGGSHSIRPLSCADVLTASWTVGKRPKMGLINTVRTSYDSISQLPLTAHIQVDLRASDEQIVNDFKQWLGGHRESLKRAARKRMFSEADFKQWSRYQALPCIDLMLWGEYQGVRYTNSLLANSLFPTEWTDSERIRKTVKPMAKRLLSPSTLNALGMQAYGRTI